MFKLLAMLISMFDIAFAMIIFLAFRNDGNKSTRQAGFIMEVLLLASAVLLILS